MRRPTIWCSLCLIAWMGSSCAFMVKENRVLTNTLDEVVAPESTTAKVALAPLFIPAGAVTLAVDAVILHPISVIPTAADDTLETIWEDPEGSLVWQTFLFVPKVVFTPIFFSFDWLFRSLFDLG